MKFTKPWIEHLAGSLEMDWQHYRDAEDDQPEDADVMLDAIANVEHLQGRLRLFDAADEMLDALRKAMVALVNMAEQLPPSGETNAESAAAIAAVAAVLDRVDGNVPTAGRGN